MDKINWYPGHMKKTRELIQSNMKMVDLVVEVIDSRIPVASRNPILPDLIGDKPEIIVLNKKDLSDASETSAWIRALSSKTVTAIPCDCESGDGTRRLLEELDRANEKRNSTKKWDRPLRMMIVGVPNVGKSSLINRLTKRRAAKTGDKPGVTRGKQWLTLENGMQLLDTPGILWPNIEDQEQGRHLAFCGAIKDEIYDISELCLEFIKYMLKEHRDLLYARYNLKAPAGAAGAQVGNTKSASADTQSGDLACVATATQAENTAPASANAQAGNAASASADTQSGDPACVATPTQAENMAPASANAQAGNVATASAGSQTGKAASAEEDDSIWGEDEEENLCTDGITLVSEDGEYTPLGAMEQIAKNRGFIMPGKRIDYERCARTVLDEFRAGRIGRITLERATL